MIKSPKILAICLLSLIITPSINGIAYAEDKKKKKKNNLSNLSQEAIEQMKLEQYLANLNGNVYNFFENSVYKFEAMGEKAVPPLLKHLKKNNGDKKIVNAVLYTLGRLGKNGARAIPVLVSYLKSNDYDTKVTAVSALGKIGKPAEKAVPLLKTLLYNEGDWLTSVTKRTLKDINTPSSKAALAEHKKYTILKKRREELMKKKKEKEESEKKKKKAE